MSSSSSPAGADQAGQFRFGLIIFGVALLANFQLSAVGWDHNLSGHHSFRQVQTAISSYYYLQNGVLLDYITPLLGPPWQVPLEFPLYQISAALGAAWTGLPLDAAGRLVSWLYFLSALPAGYLLLARFRLPPGSRLLCLALVLVSPLYLFFSRAFMIESTAFATGVWFLAAFDRTVHDRRYLWLPVAVVAGVLCCAVKITTGVVFLIAAGLSVLALWRSRDRLPGDTGVRILLRAAAAALPPLVAGLVWTRHASQVRALNPDAAFLALSNLWFWTFGDLAQRLSWTFWYRTYRVWADEIVGHAGLLVLVLYYACLRGRYHRAVTGCLLVFIGGQLVFSNLYWVHDYYFYANAAFLIVAVGICLAEMLEHPGLPRWGRRAAIVAVFALQLSAFDHELLLSQQKQVPVPLVAELISTISGPNDMIVVLGLDWDGTLPYYAGRKALMLLNGSQSDPPAVRRSIERLDPHQVAAVVIVGMRLTAPALVKVAMDSLNLGERPFIFNSSDTAIWVPLERQEALRPLLSAGHFAEFQIAGPSRATDGATLDAGQIRRQGEFDCFSPRPIRAQTTVGFASAEVDFKRVLITHSTTELVFALPPGATRVTALYGLSDTSYTDGNQTDGIELKVSHHPPAGGEQVLYSRHLNPRYNDGDRGPQPLDLAIPSGLTGELIVRVLPGPANNPAFDWAYFGQMTIR